MAKKFLYTYKMYFTNFDVTLQRESNYANPKYFIEEILVDNWQGCEKPAEGLYSCFNVNQCSKIEVIKIEHN